MHSGSAARPVAVSVILSALIAPALLMACARPVTLSALAAPRDVPPGDVWADTTAERPTAAGPALVPPSVEERPLRPSAPAPVRTHAVAAGEDWETIAAAYGTQGPDPVGEMLRWNPALEVRAPLAGSMVRIPAGTAAEPASPYLPGYTHARERWAVIASATSRFVGTPWAMRHNIIRGAQAVNEHFATNVIAPKGLFDIHEMFGFGELVTLETGYVVYEAMIVLDGVVEAVPALAGGLCNIPSTVYPATLRAGMITVERTPHPYFPYWWYQYPEGYGIDATISMPGPNLVMRNPYAYPLALRSVVDEETSSLTIEVIGPPEVTPLGVTIDGPYVVTSSGPVTPRGWLTWGTTAFIRQVVRDGERELWSETITSRYLPAPF